MAAGLPVVASRIGQVKEAIADEVNGLLVNPGDAEALAAALLRLKRDPALRTRLGQAARACVCQKHTWDAVVALTSYWSTIGFAQIGNRVIKDVRDQLYRHIQYRSLSFHTKSKTGDLVMRVISDVSLLQDVAVTAVLPMLGKTLVVVGMLGLML